jgi:hypothetical protein
VARLNASFPGQQLEPMTTREWFEELADRPAERVWEAVRACRREQSFRPSLAELLDAMTLAARERAMSRPALPAPDRLGVPPSPEVKAQLAKIFAVPDSPPPRSREEQLEAMRDETEPSDP